MRIVREIDLRVVFGTSLLRDYYLNDLHDASCKTCPFISMQSRDNDKMLQLRVQCSIYNHDHDALLRCMIAMMVQHKDGVFHARAKWCIWHNAIAMMLAQWCIHHGAKMMMPMFYAYMRCIKYDAYTDEFVMHTMQHTSYDRSLVTNLALTLYPWVRIRS